MTIKATSMEKKKLYELLSADGNAERLSEKIQELESHQRGGCRKLEVFLINDLISVHEECMSIIQRARQEIISLYRAEMERQERMVEEYP